MNELKHLGNRREPLPLATYVKLLLVVLALIWMAGRDADIDALTDVVATQSHIIGNMECAPPIEMIVPIGMES